MAREYVFFVHGIGRHPAGWEQSWVDCFLNNLRRYGEFAQMSAADIRKNHVEFVPIGYDDVFQDGFRAKWGDLTKAIANQGGLVSAEIAATLGQLASQLDPSEQSVLWDSVLDAVLWYGWPTARQAVVARVNKHLSAGIERMRDENGTLDRAHIVAHSLGTSVVHDAILCLSRGVLTEKVYDPKNFAWRTVVMVANTSRVMQTRTSPSTKIPLADFDVYRSTVQPGNDAAKVLRRYLNPHHRADPVTWPRQFTPPLPPAPNAWQQDLYEDVEVVEYGELKQVHDFVHYFDNPNVHVRAFRAMFGRPQLGSKAEREKARADFLKTHPKVAANEFAALRAFLNGDNTGEYGLVDIARFLVKTFKELR